MRDVWSRGLHLLILGASSSTSLANFYDVAPPDNCSTAVRYARPAWAVAGQVGFFGETGSSGPGGLARLQLPQAAALDEPGKLLYFSDGGTHTVRIADLATNSTSILAGVLGVSGTAGDGGPAASAYLNFPNGLALDASAKVLYIADQGNHAVRAINLGLTQRRITTVVGQLGLSGSFLGANSTLVGPGAFAWLSNPTGLCLDTGGRLLYISDAGNQQIRILNLSSGLLRPLNPAAPPPLAFPVGLAVDPMNKVLYVADAQADVVYSVDLSLPNGTSRVIAGALGVEGSLGYFAQTFDGDYGPATAARFRQPTGLALDPVAQRLYVADFANQAVRVIDLTNGNITMSVARSGYFGHRISPDDNGPVGLALGLANITGWTVRQITTKPMEGGPIIYGKYFYFQAGAYMPVLQTGTVPAFLIIPTGRLPGGIFYAYQFRRGVLVWVGFMKIYGARYAMGPGRQDFPELDSTGQRHPDSASTVGQFQIGDVIVVPGVHPPPSQMLYMAEGNNFMVRAVDLAPPTDLLCAANVSQPALR